MQIVSVTHMHRAHFNNLNRYTNSRIAPLTPNPPRPPDSQKCTHHLIDRDPDGYWQINKKTYGTECTDLFAFVERLKFPLDGWRVPLVRAIRNPELDPEWLHGEMSTEDATEMMNRAVDGMTDTEGTFFVRRKPGLSENEIVLCIYYKNKPTHHLCAQVRPRTHLHTFVRA